MLRCEGVVKVERIASHELATAVANWPPAKRQRQWPVGSGKLGMAGRGVGEEAWVNLRWCSMAQRDSVGEGGYR